MIDLTSQLHSLHHQFRSSQENVPKNSNSKLKDQIFDAALRTLDDTIREACRDARRLTITAVNAIHDRSCFTKNDGGNNNKKKKGRGFFFNATTHHPFSEELTIALELADGRLVAACSAAQQMAGAVAKTASTLKVRTDDVICSRFADRIDSALEDEDLDDADVVDGSSSSSLFSKFSQSKTKSDQNENAFAIKHVAVAVQSLSQMANEARVILALVKDEAEKVRVQRLRFAKCGVIVNPMDHIADEDTNNNDQVIREGSRLLEFNSNNNSSTTSKNEKENTAGGNNKQDTQSSSSTRNKFLSTLTTGTEEFLSNTTTKIFDSAKNTTANSNNILSKGVHSFFSSSAVVENVFQGVAKLATETTDKIVDNITSTTTNSSSSKNNSGKNNNNNIAEKQETEQEKAKRLKMEAELKSLTSPLRVDSRKLTDLANKMKNDSSSLNWRQLSRNHSDNNNGEVEAENMIIDRLGLRQEHMGLETKLKDESAQAAKEVERSIQELGRMTTILQEQVSLQTEQLLVIEKNTDESTANVEKAQEELNKHDLDKFWSFKRILSAIILFQAVMLLVLHFIIR